MKNNTIQPPNSLVTFTIEGVEARVKYERKALVHTQPKCISDYARERADQCLMRDNYASLHKTRGYQYNRSDLTTAT